jgi:NitT/TauT family transport system substrate-binding protein
MILLLLEILKEDEMNAWWKAVRMLIAVTMVAHAAPAAAETSTLRIAQQYGIGYLPFHVIKHQQLIEKHARAAGLDNLKVTWVSLGGGSVMNDALLSDSVDLVSGGVAPFITLWAKTRGSIDVKGVAALDALPIALVTTNPAVKTLKDFTAKDRIGLPSVKVSIQAVTLQMAAEQAFGEGKHEALDAYTVSLKHPDAYAALASGKSEVTAHFGGPPFQQQELLLPGAHKVIDNYGVLGGPATFNMIWGKAAFRDANPKVYGAFLSALKEAIELIKADPKEAARIYLTEDESKLDEALVLGIITDPQTRFTTQPLGITKYSDFMFRTGAIKVKPASWKDLFFADIHGEDGS